MEIKIQLAKEKDAGECVRCVEHSQLWDAYYKSNPEPEANLIQSIARKQIYMALNKQYECIGFMGIVQNGCFDRFPYLSVLAVKKDYRNRGVGKQLIEKFEEIGFRIKDRVFILVSDFNTRAQKFYSRLGYAMVGNMPDLFKPGISELLLMKYKP